MIHDQFYTYFDVEKLVQDFELILNQYGIEIQRSSELERLCLNIIDIKEKHPKPNLRAPHEDIRPYFRELLGLQDLMSKVVRAKDHPRFCSIIPHLKKLNIANPLQNINTSVLNAENNKLFELYMATLCMNISQGDITVDDPDFSRGDNPDIISYIGDRVWGFACKALHSSNVQTIFENIEKAVQQIESSSADVGIPILSIKNVINHDEFWPLQGQYENTGEQLFGAYIDLSTPISMIYEYTRELHSQLVSEIGESSFFELFQGKKSHPVCLIYCATATSIIINDLPIPTRLNMFNILTFSPNINDECSKILEELNHQLQLT